MNLLQLLNNTIRMNLSMAYTTIEVIMELLVRHAHQKERTLFNSPFLFQLSIFSTSCIFRWNVKSLLYLIEVHNQSRISPFFCFAKHFSFQSEEKNGGNSQIYCVGKIIENLRKMIRFVLKTRAVLSTRCYSFAIFNKTVSTCAREWENGKWQNTPFIFVTLLI